MIEKLKKVGIVVTVAVLLAILIFSITNAIYPQPKYDSFCPSQMKPEAPVPGSGKCNLTFYNDVPPCEGFIEYKYDSSGCPVSAGCNKCNRNWEVAQEEHDFVLFLVASIAGVLAALFGIFFYKEDDFWTLVKAGFLIGGLAALFFGTGTYYSHMARFLRPVVIFLELCLVLLVTYRLIKKHKI